MSDPHSSRRSTGFDAMAWATPSYSRSQVDKAGRAILRGDHAPTECTAALATINNWRASHQYPLNTFQIDLRRRVAMLAKAVQREAEERQQRGLPSVEGSENFLVYQRTKRLESIQRKMESSTTQLSQMQDIAGCRAVVSNVKQVVSLRKLYHSARFRHELKNEKDYIACPKDDGYRGIHLIYRYSGVGKTSCYSGLQVEVQLRTQMQHAWATAVEAVSTFTKQALKWRGGDQDWRRFFVLMGAAIANFESSPPVESAPKDRRLLAKEIADLERTLHVRRMLDAYGLTMNYAGTLKKSDAKLLLVYMRPELHKVQVYGFRSRESQLANQRCTELESSIDPGLSEQAVLVKVDSVNSLRRAYPNYFLDTTKFDELIHRAVLWW